jgi:uncharacterized protein YcbK (DUF882 family)
LKRSTVAIAGIILLILLTPLVAAPTAQNGPSAPPSDDYRLRLFHTHTGESLDVVYRNSSAYIPAALAKLDYFLRDHRTGDVRHYDPRLFDLLYELVEAAGRPQARFDVVCGYRTPWSNTYLRTHGHGVARHSLHMQAMAIDIRLPGTSTAKLRDLALALREGGVGYYAASDFIHVDVGRVRRW